MIETIYFYCFCDYQVNICLLLYMFCTILLSFHVTIVLIASKKVPSTQSLDCLVEHDAHSKCTVTIYCMVYALRFLDLSQTYFP